MAYFKWIPKPALVAREDLMNLWDAWGIQMLVIGSISFQAVLLFGNRRRSMTGRTGILMRTIFWVTYLFATEVIPYSLGKLTGLRVIDPAQPDPNIELKAFLAPLLLLQLGYPDNITAYSMEDNRLGWRQVLNMAIVVAVVTGVLIRCWSYSIFVFLYFPMFVAGIVKYAEGVWALKFALGWNIGTTGKESAPEIPHFLRDLPEETHDLKLLVKAYYRFHCLKPHLENWIYHPDDVSDLHLSIEQSSSADKFIVTEMELGFMYDVLYTKAPIIYTKLGLIVRFVSFFFLFVTLCAFRILARTLPRNVSAYTNFTFSVLTVTFLIEMYQIVLLPFSDWAIVKMAKRHKWPLVLPFLRSLAPRSARRWRRWSNKLDQFNLLTYCIQDDWTRYIKFLKCFGVQEYIKRNWRLNRMGGPVYFSFSEKVKLWEELKRSEIRGSYLFSQRVDWTLDRFTETDELRWSVEKGFDKCIVVWHIATNICYHRSEDSSDFPYLSNLISDYMMYLLAIHPYMLSVITGDIVFAHACCEIESILKDGALIKTEKDLARSILTAVERPPSSSLRENPGARITSEWDVISDSKRLAQLLWKRGDKWQIIDSFWMEMLFSATKNCRLSHHADQLRRGGELITLIWLIVAHKTDKTLAS
ncbi:uncharacterized protein LOC115744488 [Rhodamnia argentea]|uniref:Uncharacterized protein LOC115744488 n=1 Tax=Rhodamnia argentea TaxID=178133 RepID=A0A8B8PL80_9MYRT|nr:uncharacterized protein LOC115744488 [Rhodamnia argentea]